MGRFVTFVLGLAAIAFVMYRALHGTVATQPAADPTEASAPKRQLDNVRAAAHRLELEQQQAADRAAAPGE